LATASTRESESERVRLRFQLRSRAPTAGAASGSNGPAGGCARSHAVERRESRRCRRAPNADASSHARAPVEATSPPCECAAGNPLSASASNRKIRALTPPIRGRLREPISGLWSTVPSSSPPPWPVQKPPTLLRCALIAVGRSLRRRRDVVRPIAQRRGLRARLSVPVAVASHRAAAPRPRRAGFVLTLELHDDVAWEEDGTPTELLQVKHHVSAAGRLPPTARGGQFSTGGGGSVFRRRRQRPIGPGRLGGGTQRTRGTRQDIPTR